MKYLVLLSVVAFACASPLIEKREADPEPSSPYHGHHHGYHGHHHTPHYGHATSYVHTRYGRSAEPEPEPEAEADPSGVYGHHLGYGYGHNLGYGHVHHHGYGHPHGYANSYVHSRYGRSAEPVPEPEADPSGVYGHHLGHRYGYGHNLGYGHVHHHGYGHPHSYGYSYGYHG